MYVVGSGPNDTAKDWTGLVKNAPGKSSCSPKCSTRSNLTSCASSSCSSSSSELSMIGVGSWCTLHHSPGALHCLALRRTGGVKIEGTGDESCAGVGEEQLELLEELLEALEREADRDFLTTGGGVVGDSFFGIWTPKAPIQ